MKREIKETQKQRTGAEMLRAGMRVGMMNCPKIHRAFRAGINPASQGV